MILRTVSKFSYTVNTYQISTQWYLHLWYMYVYTLNSSWKTHPGTWKQCLYYIKICFVWYLCSFDFFFHLEFVITNVWGNTYIGTHFKYSYFLNRLTIVTINFSFPLGKGIEHQWMTNSQSFSSSSNFSTIVMIIISEGYSYLHSYRYLDITFSPKYPLFRPREITSSYIYTKHNQRRYQYESVCICRIIVFCSVLRASNYFSRWLTYARMNM